MTRVFHGKLLAKKEGIYTTYVFKTDENALEICTQAPNWDLTLRTGDEGFVSVKEVRAGDTYYDTVKKENVVYKYDNNYIENFIRDEVKCDLIL